MKKITATILLLCMLLALMAGCEQAPAGTTGSTEPAQTTTAPTEESYSPEAAAAALQALYADEEATTAADYTRSSEIVHEGQTYTVVWTTDVAEELVKIVPGEDGTVTIDINEAAAEQTAYVLTAAITAPDGSVHTVSWEYVLPAGAAPDQAAIVDAAYALEDGAVMDAPVTLTGLITTIHTPWSESYGNISVILTVAGREDKHILCYRLSGEGANALAVGDTITVTGTIKNYGGTIEFDAGCTLDRVVSGGGTVAVAPETPEEILAAAFALAEGESLPYEATLTGEIDSIDTPWSDEYSNITVTIEVGGKKIQCFRLKGDGASGLYEGDVITVSGVLKNYYGTIEFDSGCLLLNVIQGERAEPTNDPLGIIDVAYGLEEGESLPYKCTLTGVISKINTPWDDYYGNITVTIKVAGREDKPIMCYRLEGDGAEALAVGDTITVTGNIKNYYGTVEFIQGCYLNKIVKGDPSDLPEAPAAPEDPAQILSDAYALEAGASLPYDCTLTGVITKVNTPWSDQYKNITVTIVVGGDTSKPIMCYRLKGDGADALAVGDTITVTGNIKNYNGTIEFDAGCTLDKVVKGEAPETPEEPETPVVAPTDPAEILKAAYELEAGASLPYSCTLTGVITSIDTAYNPSFGNITVTIVVGGDTGKPIQCFRLKGDGAADLAVGDTITVTGNIKNYNGTVEFDAGCTLDKVVKAETDDEGSEEDTTEKTLAEALEEASQLSNGSYLSYVTTIEGYVSKINDAWNDTYGNISFTVEADGTFVYCYRVTDEALKELAIGDQVKVEGKLTAYKGSPQYDKNASVTVLAKAPALADQLAAAKTLANNTYLPYYTYVEGIVVQISESYSEQYKTITFTVNADGNNIKCYRVKGDGLDTLAVGDTVSVLGKLTAYNKSPQFTSKNSTVTVSGKAIAADKALADQLTEAAALDNGYYLSYVTTVEGTVSQINTKYSSQYKNITFTLNVDGVSVYCYRIAGEEFANLAVGDTVKVVGILTAYSKSAQFDSTAVATILN